MKVTKRKLTAGMGKVEGWMVGGVDEAQSNQASKLGHGHGYTVLACVVAERSVSVTDTDLPRG